MKKNNNIIKGEKKQMKKRLSVILAVLTALSLVACGNVKSIASKAISSDNTNEVVDTEKEQLKKEIDELKELLQNTTQDTKEEKKETKKETKVEEKKDEDEDIIENVEAKTEDKDEEEKASENEENGEKKYKTKDDDTTKKEPKSYKDYKAYREIEIKDDTFAIRLKNGEQIDTTYLPFYSEDKKKISLELAYLIVLNNDNITYSNNRDKDKMLEKIQSYINEGYKSCSFRQYPDNKVTVDYVNSTNPYFVTVDEYKALAEKAKEYDVLFNSYDMQKYKNKRVSFETAKKIVASNVMETFASLNIDEWKENKMKSCFFGDYTSNQIYNFKPSSSEPELD